MIKAAIFDLDGTLLNTIEDIHCVLNESLEKFGYKKVDLKQTACFVGNGAKQLVKLATEESNAELFERVYSYYCKKFAACGNGRTKLYENEEKTLIALKEAGVKLAIVTNKPQPATDAVYGAFLAKFGFCRVLGQTEYYPLKPNPASTLAIIEELKLKKEECVFVGDGETDVLTAKAAGIRCISVLWGYRTREQLEAAGAEIFAESFEEISEIIKNKF